jgi:hypothetical protein
MMQKKVAIQLGVIVVASITLVVMSVPLLKGRGPRGSRKLPVPQAASELTSKAVPVKPNSQGQTIKLGRIKDDKFYERLSRVAEALPLERDPFTFAYAGPKSSRDGLELSGILWEDEKPTAIVNQTFFKAGDSTDQFSVVKILQDRVILKDRTGEFELRLKQ